VVLAHGNRLFGYSLYLRKGLPQITLYAGQNRFHLESQKVCELNKWIHLAVTVDPEAHITLFVNGEPAASLGEGFHVNDRPPDAFSVGADIGRPAGDYDSEFHFRGLIRDVRLYWGVLDQAALKKWANQNKKKS
jgi:hypothetical protein